MINTLPYPTTCPSCGHHTVVRMPHLLCINMSCGEKLKGQLVNAAARKNLDIDGLGEEVAEALVNARLINNLASLFKLTTQQLSEMPFGKSTFGGVRAGKLHKAIQGSMSKPWHKVLHSLGCPGLGEPECEAIAQRFSLYDMVAVVPPAKLKMDLMDLKGVGDKTAVTLVEWMKLNAEWLYELATMEALNTKPMQNMGLLGKAAPLLGYNVVLTGSLARPRADLEDELKQLGAKIGSSVSRTTTILVLGSDGAGSTKHQAALKYGIKIMDEAGLAALIHQATSG
jgi:DNA ligase (NAD+)